MSLKHLPEKASGVVGFSCWEQENMAEGWQVGQHESKTEGKTGCMEQKTWKGHTYVDVQAKI